MDKFAPGPVDNTKCKHAKLTTLPFGNVEICDGFWSEKQRINRQFSLEHGYKTLEKRGTHDNFMLAAGMKKEGEWKGHPSRDSDLYKWIESAAYVLASGDDPKIGKMLDHSINIICASQAPDGYISTYYQYVKPEERWTDIEWGHELYMAGHLIQAAVAVKRLLNRDDLLFATCRFADYIGTVFAPGKREIVCGHPEIEMGLLELYRETGEKRYFDLAAFFINLRGHRTLRVTWYGSWYYPDHVPVREAVKMEGHAVRAMYYACSVADLYMETGETALLKAMQRQWHDMVHHKLYITGGVGARHDGEAFGDEYELPNDRGYCETCAAIGSIMWNWRMLLATGESRYAGVIERTLYNGFLSGVSLDGKKFFYVNPLVDSGVLERAEWYATACCPPNIMRTIASIQHYIATKTADSVQIHQYIPSNINTEISGGVISLSMNTCYPWEGKIDIEVEKTPDVSWTMSLRIPDWSRKHKVMLNGKKHDSKTVSDYIKIRRNWRIGDVIELELDMAPRFTLSNPRVEENRNHLAIERGPIVYCLERHDNSKVPSIIDVEIDKSLLPQSKWEPELLGGVVMLSCKGRLVDFGKWDDNLYLNLKKSPKVRKKSAKLKAIPYYAWANRGKSPMRVWIPVIDS